MDKTEREKIYTLLSQFYPNARELKSREKLTAYGLVLSRFSYEDVKSAVLDHASKNRYFPNVSELVGKLTPISAPKQEPTKEKERNAAFWDYVEAANAKPWHLCHVLVSGRETGGTFGDMLARHAPAACVDCPRQTSCHYYQNLRGDL